MNTKLYNFCKKITALFLPYQCILCQAKSERSQDLCEPCNQDLPRILIACKRCGIPCQDGLECGACFQEKYYFNQVLALFHYQTPIKELLLELKFLRAIIHARILGELFAEFLIKHHAPRPDVIIPIPLHKKRLQERGFNQALELARPIGQILNIPIDIKSCKRISATRPQATLPKELRKSNIKNAFVVNSARISGLRVAVLDDVMTTGHTISEFCKTLQDSNVASIDVWCIARSNLVALIE